MILLVVIWWSCNPRLQTGLYLNFILHEIPSFTIKYQFANYQSLWRQKTKRHLVMVQHFIYILVQIISKNIII
jgi:hypothetical protein